MGKVQNLWCSDYWKLHFKVKKIESRHFYSCYATTGKPLPRQVLIIIPSPQAEENYSFPKQHFFLENLFPPAEREGGEESMVSLDLHSLKPNMDGFTK